ncbi:MAG: MotA/TolQ/ExbB proton channel family protein [Desulfuromonas sp.]|nr:MotA/TolQ/ExbB proton channel family protein [Desulfuromonas sp.]
MDIMALIKSFIYLIASSLLYPVLALLAILTVWILVLIGTFCADYIERTRLRKYKTGTLTGIINDGNHTGIVSHRVNNYIAALHIVLKQGGSLMEAEVENLLQESILKIKKSLDRLMIVVRVGPGFGLIGTLIPMGTGLAALGQGDMTKLSSDLVIAFTTTVVGLALGILAFVFHTVEKRWLEEDIKNMELATEVLTQNYSKTPIDEESEVTAEAQAA